ncbi:flagellar protein FlgN [Bacillus sp. FJAT-42315]|uniref:flagellar protein FlgN n=1 Tax=Bacillus sp. FJAT-42315 TaxID=2014077 RepID=UPI000C23F163|nr:flagellar protein FlgN [Bacillus sp. FJAT-42315]
MSAPKLIDVLDTMNRLHEMLYTLAEKKTDIMKQNDMNGLDQLLKDEQKYVAAINTMEKERQKLATALTGNADATITDCQQVVHEQEKIKLQALKEQLVANVAKLKEQNELNQQLIYQSLQFVNMSMSLMRPQPEQPTYSHPTQGQNGQQKRSMFDSQA